MLNQKSFSSSDPSKSFNSDIKVLRPCVEVFILTYERPVLFEESLKSVLAQDYENFQVVVSDNSVSDDTQAIVARYNDARLIYRRRKPSLQPMHHFNQVLSEVRSDYFMLFHDDDIMLPNCLSTLMQGFAGNCRLSAVGGNATMIYNNFSSNRKFICRQHGMLIRKPSDLVKQYFVSGDYSPFPSYLYYRPLISDLRMKTNCGKHADVIFLAEVCMRGSILMMQQLVMRYRQHVLQDSSSCSLPERQALIKWVCNNTTLDRKSPEVKFYRLVGLIEKTNQQEHRSVRRSFYLFYMLAILHLRHFRLQFFFLFIRLAQRVVQKICLRHNAFNRMS